MIRRLSDWLYSKTSMRVLFLFFILDALFVAAILPACEKKIDPLRQFGVPDLQLGLTSAGLYERLEAMGADGRSFYLLCEGVIDILYPLVYAVFLSFLLGSMLKKTFPETSFWHVLNTVPVFCMLADFGENAMIITALLNFPQKLDLVGQLAGVFNMVKWSLMVVVLVTLAITTLTMLVRRFTQKPAS